MRLKEKLPISGTGLRALLCDEAERERLCRRPDVEGTCLEVAMVRVGRSRCYRSRMSGVNKNWGGGWWHKYPRQPHATTVLSSLLYVAALAWGVCEGSAAQLQEGRETARMVTKSRRVRRLVRAASADGRRIESKIQAGIDGELLDLGRDC